MSDVHRSGGETDETLPFWIDTDAGADDAAALLVALGDRRIDLRGISVVAGNVPLGQGIQNVLYLLERFAGTGPRVGDLPSVHAGAHGPLHRALRTARHVHGHNGLGDVELDLKGRQPASEPAVDALLESSHQFSGRLVVVALGPLTNLALALVRDPSLPERLAKVVFMGGTSDLHGNVSQVAEYNVWTDPEAAAIVLSSRLPTTVIGWDVSRRFAVFQPDDVEAVRRVGPRGALAMQVQRRCFEYEIDGRTVSGFDLPDALAVAIAADPTIATETVRRAVEVDVTQGASRGLTLFDHRSGAVAGEPRRRNLELVLAADRARFFRHLIETLGG